MDRLAEIDDTAHVLPTADSRAHKADSANHNMDFNVTVTTVTVSPAQQAALRQTVAVVSPPSVASASKPIAVPAPWPTLDRALESIVLERQCPGSHGWCKQETESGHVFSD